MTCLVTEVCVLCGLEDTPCEYCFIRRIVKLGNVFFFFYWKHDRLTGIGKDQQLHMPGNDVDTSLIDP